MNDVLDNNNLVDVAARTPSGSIAKYPINTSSIDEAIAIDDAEDDGDFHERRWGFIDAGGQFFEVLNIHCTNDGEGNPSSIELRVTGVLLANNELSVIGTAYFSGAAVFYLDGNTFYGTTYFQNTVQFSSGLTVSSGNANFNNSVNFEADTNFNQGYANFFNIARFQVGASDPSPNDGMAQIYAKDTAGAATLSLMTEKEAVTGVSVASTRTLDVYVNVGGVPTLVKLLLA